MVVLLVADDIDVGVKGILGEAALSRAEVLGDIDGGAVAAQDELAVETVGREVAPDTAVGFLLEDTHLEALLDKFLAEEVGIVLVIGPVEGDAKGLVRLGESFEDPAVHHAPEFAYVGIAFLPLDEHLVHVLVHLRMFLLQLGVSYIAVADEMVALDAGALRGLAVEELFPGVHRLADVDAAVVDERGLDDLVAAGLEQARDAVTEKVVADVAEMERLVGVRRGELHHDAAAGGRQLAEVRIRSDGGEHLIPVHGTEEDVQETADAVAGGDFGHVGLEPVADGGTDGRRGHTGHLHEREHDERVVAFKFLVGHLHLQGGRFHGKVKNRRDCLGGFVLEEKLWCHPR